MKTTLITTALAASVMATALADVTYSDNFDTDPIDGRWGNVVGTDYTQGSGVLTATTTTNVNSITTHSGVVSTVAPFTMTVDFTFDAFTKVSNYPEHWAGLVAHSGGIGLGAGSPLDYIVFRVRGDNGRVTISRFDDNATQLNLATSNGTGSSIPAGDIGPLVANNTYRLTLSGDDAGFFTGTLIDVDGGDGGTPGGTLITLTNTTAETTLVRGEFGIYSRNIAPEELHFDDFSVVASTVDPQLSGVSKIFDFGSFAYNPGPQTASITISNLGETQPLIIANSTETSDAGYFKVTTSLPLTIPVGGSAPLDIEFTPGTEQGPFTATLYLDSDDATLPTIESILTATVGGFNSWAAGFGIPNDENDDSDLDGIPALVEYGLGYDPTVFNSMPLPDPSGADHTVTWPKGRAAAGDPEISYAPEVSTDLVTWDPPAPGDLTESGTELVLTLTGGQEEIFARLEVIHSTP